MTKKRTNPQVTLFLRSAKKWRKEMEKLRAILLGSSLIEEFKWGKPCYTFQNDNVVIMMPVKGCCALLVCKGALLDDKAGILVKPGEHTQAVRQIRFADVGEIIAKESVLKAYIDQAIEIEKAGRDVVYRKPADFPIPAELQTQLDKNPRLKAAFAALTPGRQRGYFLHFSAPKQSKTRTARIEKCTPQILRGKGLHDR